MIIPDHKSEELMGKVRKHVKYDGIITVEVR